MATSENRALMIPDSDSDSDVTEFGNNGLHRPKTSGVKLRTDRTCSRCQSLSATELGLLLSVLINLALFLVILWTSTGYFHDICTKVPSGNATSASLQGGLNCSGSIDHITPSPPAHATDTTTQASLSLPMPSPANLTCVTSSVTCGTASQKIEPPVDPDYVNVFQDLSQTEISAAVNYLLRQSQLNIRHEGNTIFGAELSPPTKSSALGFLDSGGARPPREALVTIIFNTENPQVIRQYVVGPLPNPTYHKVSPRMGKDVPVKFLGRHRMQEAYQAMYRVGLAPELQHVLRESFGATFSQCGQKCLMPLAQKTSFGLGE
nr:hypothetical protein BaRGS_023011 [Batillaria attramentaria]